MTPHTGLTALLESLKEEIDRWELAPHESPHDADTVRYGLYLIAMDVLWCEVMTAGGYADYVNLATQAKLPEADYRAFAQHLAPFSEWLRQVNAEKLSAFK